MPFRSLVHRFLATINTWESLLCLLSEALPLTSAALLFLFASFRLDMSKRIGRGPAEFTWRTNVRLSF